MGLRITVYADRYSDGCHRQYVATEFSNIVLSYHLAHLRLAPIVMAEAMVIGRN